MNVSEIIGLKITEIRYNYIYQNGYDMQEFFAYLKLSNGSIIEIPQIFDSEIDKDEELSKIFSKAKKPNSKCKTEIENQKIIDIHFWLEEEESHMEFKAYLELENGNFVTEMNYGPIGLTTVDLEILTKADFEKFKTELDEGLKIKSYLIELKNVC
ncbi:hypothetical protein [Flavobacterium sp. CLA17]|uniref:hypothetical protein n=1 Tax=Flavobacterium sp. CLA17 TaxID=2724135 RepID=UPI001491D6A0|nr:hypothetical protein [Flavobacterium sp. CLA17]QSB29251.1 hypothetical protein HAV12_011090 [Flavobacterium sp. CLA17]